MIGRLGPAQLLLLVAAAWARGDPVAARLLNRDVDREDGKAQFDWPTAATIGLGSLSFSSSLPKARFSTGAPFSCGKISVAGQRGRAWLRAVLLRHGRLALSRRRPADTIGAAALVRGSALLTAVGMAGATLSPHPFLAIVAYAVAGLGIGNIAPVLFAGGGRVEPEAPGGGSPRWSPWAIRVFLSARRSSAWWRNYRVFRRHSG